MANEEQVLKRDLQGYEEYVPLGRVHADTASMNRRLTFAC
jgi:hypothetical protein